MLNEGFHLVSSQEPGLKPTPPEGPAGGGDWTYAGLASLNSGLPIGEARARRVDICVYRVSYVNVHAPFVLFALQRSGCELAWPEHTGGVSECSIPCIERRLVDAFSALAPAPQYRGWRKTEGALQLWFELVCAQTRPSNAAKCDGWRWAMASEVTNEGHVAGDAVSARIQDDFSDNPQFALVRRQGSSEHAPCVQAAYFCGPAKAMGYAAAVGGRRAGYTAPFGDYYYLDSYERAVASLRTAATRSCMVRYAVVVGRQSMLLGRDTDRADTSAMTRHVGMIKPIVRASARARDADGKWAKRCDSLGRGRLAIEAGGCRHAMEPRLCVQRVSDFVPLEYCGGAGSVEAEPPVSSRISYTTKHEHAD